jgi:hypothetical protein
LHNPERYVHKFSVVSAYRGSAGTNLYRF